MKALILHIILLIFIVSCKKHPKACIAPTAINVEVGESISFTDCSKNSTSREWFINGNKYSEETVSVQFLTEGNFSAGLTAFSKNKLLSDEARVDFTVFQPIGKVTFLAKSAYQIPITITVNGHGVKKITSHVEDINDCEQDSAANFILPVGMHLYTAVPQSGTTWVDSVIVKKDGCIIELLE